MEKTSQAPAPTNFDSVALTTMLASTITAQREMLPVLTEWLDATHSGRFVKMMFTD